jgi:hypothetical protein
MRKFFTTLGRKSTVSFLMFFSFLSLLVFSSGYIETKRIVTTGLSPEYTMHHTVTKQDTMYQGITVTGEPGITVTVQEIMEQEAMLPADHYTKPKPRTNPELELERPEKQPNPNAPDVSQWPPKTQEEKNTEPVQSDNPQTVGTSFLGMNISNSGFIPPDS